MRNRRSVRWAQECLQWLAAEFKRTGLDTEPLELYIRNDRFNPGFGTYYAHVNGKWYRLTELDQYQCLEPCEEPEKKGLYFVNKRFPRVAKFLTWWLNRDSDGVEISRSYWGYSVYTPLEARMA